ncbi:hypothetical protein jhhlp_003304 [Lomentospora prolificans]|uniref:Phytanoyl-CoA dioxygenase n=1 Tax=Lomentospora prolificans TaxID=41688 RepID=A0A2N3NGF5_9PEZI|nr:hypothetical protein jhhlp_003304 [Lomentospora prolificans]
MTVSGKPTGADLRAQLERDGFVVIKSILDPVTLTSVRAASARATEQARAGNWPHVRVVGKQFPPWDANTDNGIWGVQHLMNPALPDSKTFTEIYFSDAILGVVKDLLQCEDDDLVMELFNMLVRPERDFELRWHRDDIPPEASGEEELRRLAEPAWHAQYNLALYDDESLIVVPGSHRRARTDKERSAEPYEKGLPGELRVKLEPGDIVFYDNNILHRGAYDSSKERMTLHGSVGHVKGKALRARNVLQHGIGSWVGDCKFEELDNDLGKKAEGMRARLVKLGQDLGSEELGYSQEG